jgi:hypothetical protein
MTLFISKFALAWGLTPVWVGLALAYLIETAEIFRQAQILETLFAHRA